MKIEAELITGENEINIGIKWEMFKEFDEYPIGKISINGKEYEPKPKPTGSIHTRFNRIEERIEKVEFEMENKVTKPDIIIGCKHCYPLFPGQWHVDGKKYCPFCGTKL